MILGILSDTHDREAAMAAGLKALQDAGAEFFQTQAVYDVEGFARFMERANKLNTPLIVGHIVIKSGPMAKRLNETTGQEAKTIHRLLEIDPNGGGFKRNVENPLDCDLRTRTLRQMISPRNCSRPKRRSSSTFT